MELKTLKPCNLAECHPKILASHYRQLSPGDKYADIWHERGSRNYEEGDSWNIQKFLKNSPDFNSLTNTIKIQEPIKRSTELASKSWQNLKNSMRKSFNAATNGVSGLTVLVQNIKSEVTALARQTMNSVIDWLKRIILSASFFIIYFMIISTLYVIAPFLQAIKRQRIILYIKRRKIGRARRQHS